MPCHVLVTSLMEYENQGWRAISVVPLSDTSSLELIDKMGGEGVPTNLRDQVAFQAHGLPVQLVPLARALRRAVSRDRIASVQLALSTEASESFSSVYDQLSSATRALLQAAARLNYQRIITSELKYHLTQGGGWSDDEFEKNLDICVDLAMLEGHAEMRMHQLFSAYVRTRTSWNQGSSDIAIIQSQARRMIELARQLHENPSRSDLASALTMYSIRLQDWEECESVFSTSGVDEIGQALVDIGQFDAARSWCEWAVNKKEQYEAANANADHESIGKSLHLVGFCFSNKGEYENAQRWFERAVASKKRGNLEGRVDHDSLGKSLHSLGYCLSRVGKPDDALLQFELAVGAKEKGDINGRIDHQNVSMSLHQVGICLRRTGRFQQASSWFEQAVARKKHGDFIQRVDHQSVGVSLHQIGICSFDANDFDYARSWFESAVAEKQLGDVFGRINNHSLSLSLHFVGCCLRQVDRSEIAVGWFKRAVSEAEKGDTQGRPYSERLRDSLRSLSDCLNELGQSAEAALINLRLEREN